MSTYRVMIDPSMLRKVLKTDVHETRELLSWSMVGYVALWSVAPIALIWWARLREVSVLRAAGFRVASIAGAVVLAAAALLLVSRDVASLMRNQRELRYLVTPDNIVYSLGRNLVADAQAPRGPKQVVGADAHRLARMGASRKPTVFVMVLGETARAANFSLFGYERETNPQLKHMHLARFDHVTACGTSIEVSVPCLFSPYGRANYDQQLIRNSEGLLDVLRRAGFAVKWRDNQSGCKGVCDTPGVDYRKLDVSFAPHRCSGAECFDEILVRALREDLANVTDDTVIVLHMMGNHGPAYFRRYPAAFRRFTPDCRTAELRECSRAEVVNAFDNVIVYTDHVLAEARANAGLAVAAVCANRACRPAVSASTRGGRTVAREHLPLAPRCARCRNERLHARARSVRALPHGCRRVSGSGARNDRRQ
jgi:lipid A ethanolaminephosphotransferase